MNDEALALPAHHLNLYGLSQISKIPQLTGIDPALRFEMMVVAQVLPFRVSSFVLNELIDWRSAPDDPMFRLVFPRKDMLEPDQFDRMASAMRTSPGSPETRAIARRIQRQLNPHPGDQLTLNIPTLNSVSVQGIQHKYRETVLFFPREGQTCHSYCTFCFRWAQFVHDSELKISADDSDELLSYLSEHPEVTDVLFTGGDPMIMKTRRIEAMIAPLLSSSYEHIRSIRFGTKALSFWPARFLTDPDANGLLALFRKIVACGKQVAVMAHLNHWREVEHAMVSEAVAAIRSTGAVVRSQSPILKGINDDPSVWSRMWREQVRIGITPYYMFMPRDTGAHSCFNLPLERAWDIYTAAAKTVSGLARTARGPVMSAGPGKIEFLGPANISGSQVYVLRFIQARNSVRNFVPFFAEANSNATWLGDLRPAFGLEKFDFESDETDSTGT